MIVRDSIKVLLCPCLLEGFRLYDVLLKGASELPEDKVKSSKNSVFIDFAFKCFLLFCEIGAVQCSCWCWQVANRYTFLLLVKAPFAAKIHITVCWCHFKHRTKVPKQNFLFLLLSCKSESDKNQSVNRVSSKVEFFTVDLTSYFP